MFPSAVAEAVAGEQSRCVPFGKSQSLPQAPQSRRPVRRTVCVDTGLSERPLLLRGDGEKARRES
jgi:hypothetical protein